MTERELHTITERELVRLFWGKAGRSAPYRVHPALFHMLDVGLVAREFIRRSPGTFARLAAELGLAPERAPDGIGFLVALHDLGKISPGFQNKVPELTNDARVLGFEFPTSAQCDHSFTTQVALARAAGNCWGHPGVRAIAAHHGSFHPLGGWGMSGPAERPHGRGRWREARMEAMARLADCFDVNANTLLDQSAEVSPGAVMVLAGLTTLADWIGSDPSFFPPAEGAYADLASYLPDARGRAENAVEGVGWRPTPPCRDIPSFGELFPGYSATPLQRLAEEVARSLAQPGIVLIEAPMGVGKTEAALCLARICAARFGHTGIYVALPSQATSNQMFDRFRRFVERGWDSGALHVHLLHGLASFHDAYDQLPLSPQEADESLREVTPAALGAPAGDGAAREARVYAAGWFRPAKRALLAPFGVGTLDQGLMGVLPVRHMFLRLFGLANKVVILDEAHAYETYTTELMVGLVRWLRELGSTVVILSATLPARKRQELLSAYSHVSSTALDVAYPRISWAEAEAPAQARQPEVALTPAYVPPPLQLRPWPETEGTVADEAARMELARRLAARLVPGGRAAWFCNTVASAQEAYLLLDSLPELRGRVRLLHAQLPVWDRRERERRVEAAAGKHSSRSGEIELWICTQVMEQSLDVDFDAMVSELAPIDLLLQRAGRLHRHDRHDRPAGAAERVLWWLRPAADEAEEERPVFGVDARVYEPLYLLRTLALLQSPRVVDSDAEIEALVERVYGDAELAMPPAFLQLHRKYREDAAQRRQGERQQALLQAIPAPDSEDPFTPRQQLSEDEDDPRVAERFRALTRLGDPTITIVPVVETSAGFVAGPPDCQVDPFAPPAEPRGRREWERRLLLGSVRLQHCGWVKHLAAAPAPRSWEESPALRNCRTVVFRDGIAREEPGELRLHPVLGLVRAPRVLRRLGGSWAGSPRHPHERGDFS